MSEKVLAIVLENTFKALEEGVCPWQRPFVSAGVLTATNVTTGVAYKGINSILFDLTQMLRGYEQSLWLTKRQAISLGFEVKDGEQYTPGHKYLTKEVDQPDGTTRTVFLGAKFFQVYNIAQTTMPIPEHFQNLKRDPVPVPDGVAAALAYKDGPKVKHVRGDEACYSPLTDTITLPALDQFDTSNAYAATALHEIVHSTGSDKRLKRFEPNAVFGSEPYGREELVAEIGAAMLATHLGLDVNWANTASYLDNWLKAIKAEPNLLIRAAGHAQRAVDMVIGRSANVNTTAA